MKTAFKKTVAISLMLSIAFPAQIVGPALAEDIDIYAANTGASTNPNILVVIDNSANWAAAAQHWPSIKQGEAELKSLRTVISELGSDVNLGLMMFTEGTGAGGVGGPGAYIRYHVRTMTAANKTAFQEMLGDPSGCTDGANSLNGTPNCIYQNFASGALKEATATAKTDYSASMFEVFKYFGGYTSPDNALTNTAGSPVDASTFGALRYAGDPEPRSDAAAYASAYAGVSGAYGGSCTSKACYTPPVNDDNVCAKNYVIFIGNGYPTQDTGTSLLTGVGCSATQLSVPDLASGSTTTQTLLASNQTYASQAACEAAALTAHGETYNSYTCTQASSTPNTVTTDLGATTCGAYPSMGACSEAETTANAATYDSVTCTVANANCGGTTTLSDSACNEFASQAACQAQTTVGGTAYNSVTCTQKAGNCSYTQTGSATSSCRADSASCVSNAASDLAGYTSYSCGATVTAGCSYTATATASACFVSSAACSAGAAATLPGYTSYSCGAAGAACTVSATVITGCVGTNLSGGNCTAENVAPWISGYTSYSCSSDNCTGGNKNWTITGSTPGNTYTVTGSKTLNTGNTYAITGTTTNTTGISFSRVGAGAPTSTFNRVGSKTTTTYTYNVYGNTVVTSQVATGTYTGTSANNADEWARCLYQTDVSAATGKQNVTTYTIDVFKDAQDADQTKLMMSMARAGGGKYFSATNEDAIKNALRQIFSEIQSVNSVFASSSLPVSVNTQGTYLNQVFMGMFRPDGGSKPRWFGNLKQYQFKNFTGILRLADKNGDEAISSTTGFITPCADSYWTTDTGTYWNYGGSNAAGTCTAQTSAFPAAGSSSAYSDAPDGNVVEKGGAAQRLRGEKSTAGTLVSSSTNYAVCSGSDTPSTASCRIVKTCDNSNCTSLTDFTTSNATVTAAALGVADDTTKNALVNWVRGQDVDDENGNTVLTEMRPSAHGGVIHSQPAVVDYGGSTGTIAYYGGDDGVLHAVDGGKTDSEGVELWGFIAPETYGRLNRLRTNTPLVNFPGTSAALSPTAKDYFFDGSIGVYQSGSTAWIYPTQRRGGRAIYAFDVSTPTSPSLKWRKGCFTNSTSDDSNCSTGWTAIGQTWSKPQIATLSGYSSPVLIFGGGYDTCEDTDSQTRCAGTRKGAGIWFINADTGAILRYYPTNYSVPGDVALLKDSSGNVAYVYAADSGGYVYRINVGTYDGSAFTGWSSNSAATDIDIADLSSTANKERKFLFGPSVVTSVGFKAVLIGSGDREHPLYNSYACGSGTGGVTNEFYMLKDTPNAYTANIVPGDLYDVTEVAEPVQATLDEAKGWRFNLSTCEQVVNKALTIGGTTYFGTNTPISATAACTTNLGTARGYAVDFLTGAGHDEPTTYIGGGLPPSPVGGIVTLDDGTKQPFCIGCTPPGDPNPSPLQGTPVTINPTGARYRVFWYLMSD